MGSHELFLLLGVAIGVAAFLIWWLIFETEGVYLGRRVVVALYDLYAGRYDRIKQFDESADITLISQPLLDRIAPDADPLILDVATGTGRVPLLMARNARFQGHVIGLDASGRMLDRAREKAADARFEPFVSLIQHDASKLPFEDSSFDVVTCLEALEFMPRPGTALAEMVRVLRPGGLLLTTIRIDTRWMPGRTWTEARMRAELEALGMRDIDVLIWQEDYSQVWALKAGSSQPIGAGGLEDAMQSLRQVAISQASQIC
ncbi:MAG: class I SAM-dependent methyltransferase [Chloroflexi bacterium]|nr:class I SAM-dependent methyltransferase [Chloroflexota bacterium]